MPKDPRPLSPEGIYVKRWAVEGTSGKPWTVSVKGNGEWGCSCPAWTFKKVHPRPDCQHILRTKIFIGFFGQPQSTTPVKKQKDDGVIRSITFEE